MCVALRASKDLVEPVSAPVGDSELPSLLRRGCVLVGLEFGVIVWELVEEDGYGQTVEDDSKRDADESEETTQDGLRVDVSVAHSGDADLQGMEENSRPVQTEFCLMDRSWTHVVYKSTGKRKECLEEKEEEWV